ncbi:MAG TPA: ABC transporter permease [Vicinamibacterales bacterium]|nr:ABC transporter permease [Vicinamibacterales bacterium]
MTATAPTHPHPPALHLPDEPLVVIEPRGSWVPIDLRELVSYRELLYFLVWRDVKVRYKQAALGILWAVLQPLFLMLIFTIFYGRLARVDTGGIPYPLFAYAGLVLWMFFANAITSGGNSLVGNSNLISKVYFPRLLVPASSVLGSLVDFGFAFVVLVPMLLYYRVAPTLHLLALPLLAALTVLFAIGVGMWMAAVNVRFRDVRFALPFAVQVWLFISSVIFPSSAVPEGWRWLTKINPMSAYVEGFRSALFGQPFDWVAIGIAAVLTILVLIYATFVFRRMERSFADVI